MTVEVLTAVGMKSSGFLLRADYQTFIKRSELIATSIIMTMITLIMKAASVDKLMAAYAEQQIIRQQYL